MLQSARRYLRAAGSIMDIMPADNYEKFISSESLNCTLRKDAIAISNDVKKITESAYSDDKPRLARTNGRWRFITE